MRNRALWQYRISIQPGVQAGQTGFVIKAEEVKIKMRTPQLLFLIEEEKWQTDRLTLFSLDLRRTK